MEATGTYIWKFKKIVLLWRFILVKINSLLAALQWAQPDHKNFPKLLGIIPEKSDQGE